MRTFQEYIVLSEQPGGISGPGSLPGGPGGGLGGPPGGGLGGPPGGLGGGGPLGGGGGAPPLGGLGGPPGGGPMSSDPMATPQGPASNQKPMELKPLDVWGVLEQLLDGKSKTEDKPEEEKEVKKSPSHLET